MILFFRVVNESWQKTMKYTEDESHRQKDIRKGISPNFARFLKEACAT